MEEMFRKENIRLLFEAHTHGSEFIAETGDSFSTFSEKESFTRDWAWQFPAGRYVITIYQRHSLYQDGKAVWVNPSPDASVGRDCRFGRPLYVLAFDRAGAYTVPSWGTHKLVSHILHSEADPLQPLLFSLKEAENRAAVYSRGGQAAAVLLWYADFDMY